MRPKQTINQKKVDDAMIKTLETGAALIIGTTLNFDRNYPATIEPLHVVLEERLDNDAGTVITRARPCIDLQTLNSVTVPSGFNLNTGRDLSQLMAIYKGGASLDNVKSFYMIRLPPSSARFLVTVWRGLVVAFFSPIFGWNMSPLLNQRIMDFTFEGKSIEIL